MVESCALEQEPLVVDGSVLEGGGQLVRNAVSYAALLGTAVRVTQVRHRRPAPGLRPQHITGVRLVAELCGAQLEDAMVNRCDFTFKPPPQNDCMCLGCLGNSAVREARKSEKATAREFVADTTTAGSVSLLLQVALPILLLGRAERTKIRLLGGTNAEQAPQVDYLVHVFLPVVNHALGLELMQLEVVRRGFWPKGGGVVTATVEPVKQLRAFQLTSRGEPARIRGRVFVAGRIPRSVGEDMRKAALTAVRSRFPGVAVPCLVEVVVEPVVDAKDPDNASGALLWIVTTTGCVIAGSSLGNSRARKVNGSAVGKEAAEMLIRNWDEGGCVDEYLQDQLIVFMALAAGTSAILTGSITFHTETAMHIATLITGAKFTVKKVERGAADVHRSVGDSSNCERVCNVITCNGVGHINELLT